MTATETTAEMILVAIGERSARQRIADDLAGVLTSVHAGQRLSAVAESLVHVAATAVTLAEELAEIGNPDTDRPPMADAIAAEAHRVRRQPSRPRVNVNVLTRADFLRHRAVALRDAGAPVVERRDAEGLPRLREADKAQLDQWETLILALEVEYLAAGRPFTEAVAEVAA